MPDLINIMLLIVYGKHLNMCMSRSWSLIFNVKLIVLYNIFKISVFWDSFHMAYIFCDIIKGLTTQMADAICRTLIRHIFVI